MSKALEIFKRTVAIVMIYGAVLIPVPLMWAAAIHLNRYDNLWSAYVIAGFGTIPMFVFGLYTSVRLSIWFMKNWGRQYLK